MGLGTGRVVRVTPLNYHRSGPLAVYVLNRPAMRRVKAPPEHDLLPLPWAEARSRRPENKNCAAQ